MNWAFYITVVSALLITSGACSGGGESRNQNSMDMAQGEHAAHAGMDMDSDEPTDRSIYNVSSRWRNRYGEQIELGSLAGRVQVVAMVYTHCEYACPRILADMKRIQQSLSEGAFEQTNFVIISIDPERDVPDRLNQFARENNLRDEQWTLLNGSQGDVLEMAALLGVKYKRISETDFTHSNIVTVLNKRGEVAYQRTQLTDRQTSVVEAIENLVPG